MSKFCWYLDLTPNRMFSLGGYPVEGKEGLSLFDRHGRQLEMKEVVVFDWEATEIEPPGGCCVCEG